MFPSPPAANIWITTLLLICGNVSFGHPEYPFQAFLEENLPIKHPSKAEVTRFF